VLGSSARSRRFRTHGISLLEVAPPYEAEGAGGVARVAAVGRAVEGHAAPVGNVRHV